MCPKTIYLCVQKLLRNYTKKRKYKRTMYVIPLPLGIK